MPSAAYSQAEALRCHLSHPLASSRHMPLPQVRLECPCAQKPSRTLSSAQTQFQEGLPASQPQSLSDISETSSLKAPERKTSALCSRHMLILQPHSAPLNLPFQRWQVKSHIPKGLSNLGTLFLPLECPTSTLPIPPPPPWGGEGAKLLGLFSTITGSDA